MAKLANKTFYATVIIDILGAETITYSGKVEDRMHSSYDQSLHLASGYIEKNSVYQIWNYDESKMVDAARIEKRHYLPGNNSSVDRLQSGLRGDFEVLESQDLSPISASEEEPEIASEQPFQPFDIVVPDTMYLHNPKWQYASVIGIHNYGSQVDGGWVVDLQRMIMNEDGKLILTPVKEYMLAAWEVKLYRAAGRIHLVK